MVVVSASPEPAAVASGYYSKCLASFYLTGLAQGVQKEAPVIVIMKNVLATISPRHDVVISPGGLNANAACHVPFSAKDIKLSSSCTLTPFSGGFPSKVWAMNKHRHHSRLHRPKFLRDALTRAQPARRRPIRSRTTLALIGTLRPAAARQRGRGSERGSARERCAADEADAGGGGAEAVGCCGLGEAEAAAGRSFKSGGRGWW